MERTFLCVKPDGLQRGLLPEIFSRFQRKGWKLVAAKFTKASEVILEEVGGSQSA